MKVEADWQAISREETRFFGSVCAAISHEINNRLAVINEKAGLVGDLAMLLVQGKAVDPERLVVQSQKIAEQIQAAKRNVQNLNRFAHSVDVQCGRIEAVDLVHFVVELFARKATGAEVAISLATSGEDLFVSTNPYLAETLIGHCVDIALERVVEPKTVVIEIESSGDGIRLKFAGLGKLDQAIDLGDDRRGISEILTLLGARYRSAEDGTRLILEIPDQEHRSQGRSE